VLTACANPVPPSGGPRDETPPRVVRSLPPADSVNVATSTRSIRLEFSEYVQRGSLPRAISLTPAFDEPLRYDWDGRAVNVELPDVLRDSTTYILTLGTELQDTRGVSLSEPITVAFSTGPRINQGRIAGRVVDPARGRPQQGVDVYAYAAESNAAPDSLPDRPAYRTQTGEDGTFTFDYMREQRYTVVALRDNNRNRQPDRGEPFAPPPRATFTADSLGARIPVPWLLASTDTRPPTAQRARPITRQRVAVRFSEPVRLPRRATDRWMLRDTTRGDAVSINTIYRSPDASAEIVLRTGAMQETGHRLVLADSAVTDTVGNPLRADTVRFEGVGLPDTLQTRFSAFGPPRLEADSAGTLPLLPGVAPTLTFNQGPGDATVREAVSVQDTLGHRRSISIASANGVRFEVRFDSALVAGQMVDIRVDANALRGADTTYVQRYRRVVRDVLGELEGRVVLGDTAVAPMASPSAPAPASPGDTLSSLGRDTSGVGPGGRPPGGIPDTRSDDSIGTDSLAADTLSTDAVAADTLSADTLATDASRPTGATADTARTTDAPADSLRPPPAIVVELRAEQSALPVAPDSLVTVPDSAFVFGELPEGSYRFRAFIDRNENGRWDPGSVVPYRPPEPITWSTQPVDSRKRWTTVLPAPLRIVRLR